jgi:hypothetical protein
MKFASKFASRLCLESLESRLQPGSVLYGSLGLSLLGSLSVLEDLRPDDPAVIHQATQASSAMTELAQATQVGSAITGPALAALDLQGGPATQSPPAFGASIERLATHSSALAGLLPSAAPNTRTAAPPSQGGDGGGIYPQGGQGVLFSRAQNNVTAGASQDFPDSPEFTNHFYDPFTVDADTGWDLTAASFPGVEQGNPAYTVSINMAISTVANDKYLGDVAVVTGGSEALTDTLHFNLSAAGIHLDPGNYYVSVWVERPRQGGGQWFWRTANGTATDQAIFHNPGGGFGRGIEPAPSDRFFTSHGPQHMAYELDGRITP